MAELFLNSRSSQIRFATLFSLIALRVISECCKVEFFRCDIDFTLWLHKIESDMSNQTLITQTINNFDVNKFTW